MSKKNKTNKRINKGKDRFDWITPGLPELQEDNIEVHLIPKKEDLVTIPRSEYDALIENRCTVKLIERMIDTLPSYQTDEFFRGLFGKNAEEKK